ncbi:MAG: CoA transferase [Acidimicrobiia bacterium]|nr:CoA transferase [Acidimicrobiia bacterium]
MIGPLDGIRILDVSAVVSGPLTATLLADQGAEVVKVEPPLMGDVLRWIGSNRNGMSGMFCVANRGKRSIVLNLADPRGVELFLDLAERSDVVIHNFRPGVVDRMGIGYEAVAARRSDAVYLSISGFGSAGPYSSKRVYDNIIQVYSGLTDVQADPATGEPQPNRQLLCDKLTSYTAAQAVTAALFSRERTGEGQHIELSMLDTAIGFLWPDAAAHVTLLGDDVVDQPTIGSSYNLIQFADGFGTMGGLSDVEFQAMCAAFELSELGSDPRFATLPDRMSHLQELMELFQQPVAERAASMSTREAERRFLDHDVPGGITNRVEDLHLDPQVQANGILVEREHPVAGPMREPRPAPRFSKTPAAVAAAAPTLGQHTDDVLAELGHGDRVDELRAAGVVG